MPFGDHLDELRSRLIKSLIVPFAVAIPCLIFGSAILRFFMRPIQDALAAEHLPTQLLVLSPIEAFISYIKISIVAALVVAGPVILFQVWGFVQPGLRSHEKRFARLLVPFSAVLMLTGVSFLYFVALPLSMQMMIRFTKNLDFGTQVAVVEDAPPEPDNGNDTDTTDTTGDSTAGATPPVDNSLDTNEVILPQIPRLDHQPYDMRPGEMYFDTRLSKLRIMMQDSADEEPYVLGMVATVDTGLAQQFQLKGYLNLVLALLLAFSLAFQLPLVILLLGWVGIVDIKSLKANRKYAILGGFIFGAVLTPPDIVSQVSLALPMYLLYELAIILLRVFPIERVSGAQESGQK